MRRSKVPVKQLVLAGLLAMTSGHAQALETVASADQIYGNITKGHLGVTASLSLSSTSNEGQSAFTVFSFSARSQYFLADRIGLGPVLKLSTQTNFSDLSIGPSVLYYFWTRDRLGAFISQDVTLRTVSNSGNSGTTFKTESQLGLNYFLYPSVAVGPAVDFIHQFGTASFFSRVNQVSFFGQFSIYL
ncbi:MAG: hypothetical protein HY074_20470 [Deltaproteobacteria bacterium]|nr:hypothetical protein [Deltaproteobacteria bacterium]